MQATQKAALALVSRASASQHQPLESTIMRTQKKQTGSVSTTINCTAESTTMMMRLLIPSLLFVPFLVYEVLELYQPGAIGRSGNSIRIGSRSSTISDLEQDSKQTASVRRRSLQEDDTTRPPPVEDGVNVDAYTVVSSPCSMVNGQDALRVKQGDPIDACLYLDAPEVDGACIISIVDLELTIDNGADSSETYIVYPPSGKLLMLHVHGSWIAQSTWKELDQTPF